MSETNWEILKFKYEVLGVSLEALSLDTKISLPILRHNAKEGDWNKLPLAEDPESSITQANDVSKLYSALKQKALSSKYIELEMVLLFKAVELANNLETENSSNVLILKNLTEILTNLLANNPSLRPELPDTSSTLKVPQSWEINIIHGNQEKTNQTLNVKGEK